MALPFELNKRYNFNTLAPSLLGATFKNATVIGIVDYVTASSYINPDAYAANIYPYLPVGTIRDPKKYTYILLVSEIGIKTAIAWQWIDPASVVLVASTTLTITVVDVPVGTSEQIRDALLLLGINTFSIVST